MESRTNFYPVYVSGQYLTSEHLNETHNFLWEEEKATRYLLIGNGVSHGLNADFTGTSTLQNISVTAGVASTIDGYLISAPTDIQFNKGVSVNLVWYTTTDGNQAVINKTDFDTIKNKLQLSNQVALTGIELLASTIDPAKLPDGNTNLDGFAVTAINALNNYIVIAFVDIVQLANNHCQQGDCNTKGIQSNLNVRYCLIPSNQILPQNTTTPELSLCTVARIKNMSASGSKIGFFQKTFDAWKLCENELSPYFTDNSGKQLKIIANILGANSLAALNLSTTKFNQIKAAVTNANCPQYYVGFANDLAKAINELIEFYNVYSRKCHTYNQDRIGKTAILGKLRSTGIDSWRYYFVSDFFINEIEVSTAQLNLLLNRVLAMVDNFILPSSIISKTSASGLNPPRQTPTIQVSDALLQNCAIPYYYDIAASGANNTLLKTWNPNGGNLKDIYCYYDPLVRPDMKGKMMNASWHHINFFLIEGHLGMALNNALELLQGLIKQEGLPIQLLDIQVSYNGPTSWRDFYELLTKNMKKWSKELKGDYRNSDEYKFGNFKRIHDDLGRLSYRDTTRIIKLVKDLNAFNGVMTPRFDEEEAIEDNRERSLASKQTRAIGIPREAVVLYKKVVNQEVLDEMNRLLKIAKADIRDTTVKKELMLKDLKDIEYLGGAPRGGTFILIHDGTNVIGDGCLPYYYKIESARIKNDG